MVMMSPSAGCDGEDGSELADAAESPDDASDDAAVVTLRVASSSDVCTNSLTPITCDGSLLMLNRVRRCDCHRAISSSTTFDAPSCAMMRDDKQYECEAQWQCECDGTRDHGRRTLIACPRYHGPIQCDVRCRSDGA